MAHDQNDVVKLTGVTVKQVVKPCNMVDCTHCREMEINVECRDLRGAMGLSDRLTITDRCAYCVNFEGFDLFVKKNSQEGWGA